MQSNLGRTEAHSGPSTPPPTPPVSGVAGCEPANAIRVLGYESEGDVVRLTMTRDDYDLLLLAVGFGAGSRANGFVVRTLGLMDRLNAGNPAYRPYGIPEGL